MVIMVAAMCFGQQATYTDCSVTADEVGNVHGNLTLIDF